MKKLYFYLLALILVPTGYAAAICPVCTVAVVAGLGLSRWLGIDDTISGLWIGGLMACLIWWTIKWLASKRIQAWYWQLLTALFYIALIIYPLYHYEIIGHPLNALWGVDKLLLGIIAGAIFFTAGDQLYPYLKKINRGRAHFPGEKVVLPVSPLIILSVIFYFITKH